MISHLASWPRSWTEMARPDTAWRTLATTRPVAWLTNWLLALVVVTTSSVLDFMGMVAPATTAFPKAERTDSVPMPVVAIVGFGCRLEPDTALLGVLAAAGATVAAASFLPDPDVPASDFFGKTTSRGELFLPFSSFFPLTLLPSLLTIKVKV